MTQHEDAIREIANEVDRLITKDKTVRARFTKHIDRFCKIVEDYGQALQSYAKKLERTKKRPDGRFQMMWWDKKFINIDTSVIYRPAEPVNPLLWFEIFDGAVIHRNPTKKEHLMRNYVLLAAIHNGELQGPFYRPLFSSKYDGKWFRRDDFREWLWEYYHYDANASPDKTRIFGPDVSESESERLERLENARDSVKFDLAETKHNAKRIIAALLISFIMILLFELFVYLRPVTWIINHPRSYGIQGSIICLIPCLIFGFFKPGWRGLCWGSAVALIVGLLSLL